MTFTLISECKRVKGICLPRVPNEVLPDVRCCPILLYPEKSRRTCLLRARVQGHRPRSRMVLLDQVITDISYVAQPSFGRITSSSLDQA